MRYTNLGKSNLKISRICLGTMHFGNRAPEDEAIQIMDRALDNGRCGCVIRYKQRPPHSHIEACASGVCVVNPFRLHRSDFQTGNFIPI